MAVISYIPMSRPAQVYFNPKIVMGARSLNAPILNFMIDLPLDVVPYGKMINGLTFTGFFLYASTLSLILLSVASLATALCLSKNTHCTYLATIPTNGAC